jgi:membrane fusion protein (multidrug efflux system)
MRPRVDYCGFFSFRDHETMPIDDDYAVQSPGFAQSPPAKIETHTHYHLHLPEAEQRQPADSDKNASGKDKGNEDKEGAEKAQKTDGPAKDGKEGEDAKDDPDAKNGDAKKDAKKGGNKKPLIILGVVVVVVAIGAFIYWFATRNHVTTDDAYTDGNTIMMAPKVSGYVVALYINDNVHVHKGDLLLRIEQDDYLATQAQDRAALASARAELEAARVAYAIARVQYPAQLVAAEAQQRAAEASYQDARASYKRQHEVDKRATTQQDIDASDSQSVNSAASVQNAKSQLAVAKLVKEQIAQAAATVQQRAASVEQAQAQLEQANLNVGYTEIRAPSDGFITKRSVQLGSYLAAGTTMFLIVTPEVWVTANFKESQLGRMRPGDAVDMGVDA